MLRFPTAVLLSLAASTLGAPASADVLHQRYEYRRSAMGTEARIVLYAGSEESAREAAQAAFETILSIERVASDWMPDSQLSRLGALAGTEALAIDERLFVALQLATGIAAVTEGAFDPTIGALTQLWREHERAGTTPTPEEIQSARALVDWTGLELDLEAQTARLRRPGMSLDLGGIAKGFAGDAALAQLEQRGIASALIDIGGDLVAGAAPPERSAWHITLDCGAGEPREIELVDAAVATSGDAFQHVVRDGERYSHVLDPETGWGVQGGLCASVVAPSGAIADALASAVNVSGVAVGATLVARFPGARLIPQDPRFEELFDGKTLNGWTTVGGRYDGHASWSIEDGCIVGRTAPNGAGGLLYTKKKYASFDLELETLVEYPFDSGIFVRMAPRGQGKGAQVTLDEKPNGEIAGIYSDGWLQHNPDGAKLWKRDEWNHVRVRCTGFDMRLEVWINGTQTLDWSLPPNTAGYAPTGLIGIQVHGAQAGKTNSVRYRNLRVRELPLFGERFEERSDRPGQLKLGAAEKAEGWTDLFEGGLDAWEKIGAQDGYRFENGVMSFPASGESGYLRSREDYKDFRLRLDFKPERMANSGLFLRAERSEANPAYSGCELQILDDFNWEATTNTTLKPWQFTGSLYGAVAAGKPTALRPIGEWNTFEVLYRGSRLAVALNGHSLFDVDTAGLEVDPPFTGRAAEGFLGLQRYVAPNVEGDTTVRFRNAFLQRLR